MLPLSESMLSSSNVGLIGDFALFMSRKFRIGWAPYWSLANPGDSFVMSKVKEAATDVFIERHESLPGKIFFFLKILFAFQQHLQFSVSWVFGLVSKYVGGSYVKGSMLNQNFVNIHRIHRNGTLKTCFLSFKVNFLFMKFTTISISRNIISYECYFFSIFW